MDERQQRIDARTITAGAIGRAMNSVSIASDEASRGGFEGVQQDLDQIFIELLRVQSSLLTFRRRAFRALPPEADWLRPQ